MARAVKDVLGPRALVFGPVMAGWTGFINLDQKRPPAGYEYFLEYYLAEMRRAGQADGRRLLDALDVHLYPEATNGGSWAIANEYAPQEASQIVVREQAPRTFWDPQYYEQSWITQYGVVPPCGYGCTPQMIPRLERMIATHDPPFSRADGQPGTHLAISEYALYRAGDISGAIAQADMLGILGREGVYEASAWANSSEWAPGYGDSATAPMSACGRRSGPSSTMTAGAGTSGTPHFRSRCPTREVHWTGSRRASAGRTARLTPRSISSG